MQSARVRRVLQLVFLLEAEPRTIEELQEILSVSRATVFRDIDLITKAGFTVQRVPLRGYQIDRITFMPPGPMRVQRGEQQIVIRFPKQAAEHLRITIWHPTQLIEELSDGGVIFRARVSDMAEVAGWCMQFEGAEVLQPSELRKKVHRLALRLAEINLPDSKHE